MSRVVDPWSPVEIVEGEHDRDPRDSRRLTLCTPLQTRALISVGRRHAYEGWTAAEIDGIVAIAAGLSARWMVVVNAAGGLNPHLREGALMVIEDIVSLHARVRSDAVHRSDGLFATNLHRQLEEACVTRGVGIERGVYAYVLGPTYETRAEIRMLRRLGADAVGMSTFPEVAAAHRHGLKTLGISLITNVASEHPSNLLSHDDVVNVAARRTHALRTAIEVAIAVLATARELRPDVPGRAR